MKKGFICRVNSNKMNREEKKSIGKIIKALEALSAHPSPFFGKGFNYSYLLGFEGEERTESIDQLWLFQLF